MSKEVEDRQSCNSNVVARLMGLEALPQLHLHTASLRSRSRSGNNEAGKFRKHCRGFEDGYGTWESPQKAKLSRRTSDKELDLVRRKFMEAKRLVVDDKLHRSKEFQEALEVLSSNKDLFVKFLQDSNSLFSHHLSEFQTEMSPHHPEDKRITVLRPSKAVVEDNKQIKKMASSNQDTGWIDAAQPTRIVVLKPSPGKALDIKAIAPSYFDEAGDSETRKMAKEVTSQIRETFWGHCRNEALSSPSSSVLSNGYIGDDGSLPSSRHSWECVKRFESHFSSSSLSRASFSPGSSVYREAKKRLSERWAKMSLNGDTLQQKIFPKTSTALGDMLTLSEKKVPTRSSEDSNKAKEETRRSISCIGSGLDQLESTSDSLNTLGRSNSVPEIRLNGLTSLSPTSKPQANRELTESRSLKSSWKVPSLFFFRNKKANKEKTDALLQLAVARNLTSEGEVTIPSENQDQPSPVSVLQQPFEEECIGKPECCGSTKPWITQGEETSLKYNLIDKSPPIGSIARVCSWEDESYTVITKPGIGIKEDEDWYDFIKTLLKVSGFSGSGSLMTRWHSPDSPLDPSLRHKFANKELTKRRKHRSDSKLVFDCVNAIITETTSTAARTGLTEGFDMVEHVWKELKNWAVHDSNSVEGESEAVGKMWNHNLQIEMDNLGIEIEVVLLQELVEDAVFDLTR